MKPAISVITCTYNRPEWLTRAIQTVLAQSFTDWEMIIVNDGEKLPEIPRDERIKVLSPGHLGQPMALNMGIKAATADLITFLDDDDTYRPANLALKVEAMKDGTEMAYFPILAIPGEICGNHAWTKENLLDGLCTPNLGTVFRKSVFDRFGYHDERCPVYWDWDWELRAFFAGLEAKFVDHDPIGEYYVHSASVVRTRGNDTFHRALRDRATGQRTNELTLVIPMYNYPQYHPRLVESVFKQTCPNWRLIVVDDGSSGEKGAQLRAMYKDLKRRYSPDIARAVQNRKNKGTCGCLAQGFKMVKTAYCAAIDADNFFLPDYVIRMIDHLDSHPEHVGAHCAFAQYVDMKPTGAAIGKAPITYENSLSHPPGTILATWRTEIALKALPEFELCPDWDMMLRGVEQGPVGYIEDPLVGWEDHKTSRWWWDLQASEACSDACRQATLERRGMAER